MKHAQSTFRNPHNLPIKQCAACRKPFHWRKKWAQTWDSVLYCSERCRRAGRTDQGNSAAARD